MKKIMFNDDYGLTQAVIDKIKTMTRRIVSLPKDIEENVHHVSFLTESRKERQMIRLHDKKGNVIHQFILPFQVGEVVAVAQRYKECGWGADVLQEAFIKKPTIFHDVDPITPHVGWIDLPFKYHKGWNNKMFVSPKLMKHHIEFTSVKFERLRNISDVDCFKEGIVGCGYPVYDENGYKETISGYTVHAFAEDIGNPWSDNNPLHFIGDTPQTAFIVLCSKLYGKQLLKSNPFVLAYTFKKVD